MSTFDPELLVAFVEEARGYLPEILSGLRDASRPGHAAAYAEPHRLVQKASKSFRDLALAGLQCF